MAVDDKLLLHINGEAHDYLVKVLKARSRNPSKVEVFSVDAKKKLVVVGRIFLRVLLVRPFL